ncbi:MAG TPA: anthranilate synthase component I family protein [Gemmatimonadaceae bacterium]|nr:anthranilate synthase component I family protein [Gemmatimonadaceae bacterium]
MSRSTFEAFAALARTANIAGTRVVPVWRDCVFDADTPVSAFAKLRREPFGFLLESAPAGGETWARYTYLGTQPRSAWRYKDGVVEDWTNSLGWHNERSPDDPLADLDALIASATPVDVPELGAFWTGAVGYFGYDIVRLIERLPKPKHARADIPDALFVFTRAMVIVDNLRAQARIVVSVVVPADASDDFLKNEFDAATRESDDIEAGLNEPSRLAALRLDSNAEPATGLTNIDRDAFIDRVNAIKRYIRAGDCFQALISRRIDLRANFSGSALYRALRALNPSPYMFHLVLDGLELVGSSPELLVRLADDRITLRPIAGTRPRGKNLEEDVHLSKELLNDPKERAEHIMLVDLGRNDVGRVAKYGSVLVSDLMIVEKYSHVLHLVSQVEGSLQRDMSAMDVFRAAFPAGTMTGAPKVRAMEIIDELEEDSRGPYAGAVGYIAGGGRRMDLAITIRTCIIADGVASVQAGAGIVADSVPESEWNETESKARALLAAIGQVRASGSR